MYSSEVIGINFMAAFANKRNSQDVWNYFETDSYQHVVYLPRTTESPLTER